MERDAMRSLPTPLGRGDNMSNPSFPSRPTSQGKQIHVGDVDPNTALGQFSFAPATQTTVVTTTTTTTTRFPPFLMRPPKQLRELDVKQYPLAGVPTPASLRNISFLVDGKVATFREAEDTSLALQKLHDEHDSLESSHGTIQRVQNFSAWVDRDVRQSSRPFAATNSSARARPVSPESTTENEEVEEQGILGRSRPLDLAVAPPRLIQPVDLASSKRYTSLRSLHTSNPITPDTGTKDQRRVRRRALVEVARSCTGVDQGLPSPRTQQQVKKSLGPARRPISGLQNQIGYLAELSPEPRGGPSHELGIDSLLPQGSVVPTPPVEPGDRQLTSRPPSRRSIPAVPSRLNLVDNSSGQDGSLPSPSLSPVTAAANIQNAGYFADVDSGSELASQHGQDIFENGMNYEDTPSRSRFESPVANEVAPSHALWLSPSQFTGSPMIDIPALLDYFEAIPDELKSYVMHQLLRRCPKSTLHVIADAVNPALKCDFLSALPTELGLNILKFLDLRSLCKAAQVSKKWRQMINGDEKAWKQLFDADGFTLREGELQRSITEGWGWQDPYGFDGYEKDISRSGSVKSESDGMASSPNLNTHKRSTTGILRRSKRKAATILSNRSKQLKRKDTVRELSSEIESIDWMAQMSTAEGPYNAANAAILAVPYPKVGLPSLKSLHLYKSLYRRHYLIRRNWMREDTKPHHIAFRAHDRHVITCLQFDTDKILTGSDDNNINVYDAKTGALRVKLEGHEGGVWALQYEGNTLVSGSTDRSVRVWDIEQGLETQVFRGHTSTVRCLQIVAPVKVGETAEGKAIMVPKYPLIITGSRDSTLRVWRLPQPGDPIYIQPENATDDDDCPYFLRSLTGHTHSVRAIAAFADTLVSGSYDSSVRVWKISTGETVHRLQGHTAKVYSVVLDTRRGRCISGSMDNMVKIWSLDTGSLMHTLDGHSSLVGLLDLNYERDLSFERLVSAAADSTLRIWDPENGQCKATLSAHTGAITCFQHDSQKVISGSDRTLKMWNVKTGECIKDLLSDLSGVWQVKFNERRCVAAVQRDNMTYIEVLDFGAARDGVPESRRGRRIVVDADGVEIANDEGYLDLDGNADS